MAPEKINQILDQLGQAMNMADDAAFKQMSRVRRALRRWKRAGAEGEMPHRDELVAWGILPPATEAVEEMHHPPALSAAEAEALLKVVRQRIIVSEMDEEEQLEDILDELLAWRDGGRVGPLPQAETLEELGLWPLAEAPAADERLEPAPSAEQPTGDVIELPPPSEPAAEESIGPSLAPPAEDDVAPLPVAGPSTEAAIAPPPSEPPPDLDDALQAEYEAAQRQFDDGQFYAAMQAFDALRGRVRGRLVEAVRHGYNASAQQLDARTDLLKDEARQYTADNPDNLQGQRRRWEEVREFNPDSQDALMALHEIDQRQIEIDTRADVLQIRRSAEAARERRNATELNTALGNATALQSGPMSDELRQDVDQLVSDIGGWWTKLRDELGLASTMAVGGELRPAYKLVREQLEAGVAELVDAGGLLGEPNALVETARFFDNVRPRYLDALDSLVSQRRGTAEEQQKSDPALALGTLQEALERLTEDLLTPDDKRDLMTNRELVEREIEAVKARLERYRRAEAQVVASGQAGVTPEKRLNLLVEAREIYPDYPNLETYIEGARQDLAAVAAGAVRTAIVAARGQMLDDEFEQALDALKQARATALKQTPHPSPGSSLAQRLQEVEALEDEISLAQRDYQRLLASLEQVDQALADHDAGEPAALSNARRLLEELSDTEQKHPETKKRLSALGNRQGHQENWKQGQSLYRRCLWAEAEGLLQKAAEENSPYRNEALPLAARAEAGKLVQEARQAEKKQNWGEASHNYAAAQKLLQEHGADSVTSNIEAECQATLARLAPLKANDQRIQKAINEAQGLCETAKRRRAARRLLSAKVESLPEYSQAVQELDEALKQIEGNKTTLMETWQQTREQARDGWREAYLEAMQEAAGSDDIGILRQAVARANELQAAGLLYERDDKDLARKLQAALLDAQLAKLGERAASSEEESQRLLKIEDNRQQRLDLEPKPGDDLRKAYEEARRRRVEFTIGYKLRESVQAAYDYLKQEMDKPSLYADEKLLAELMDLCWRVGDWAEAERRTTSLAYRHPKERFGPLSQVWAGLTQAARWYASGDYEQARATAIELQRRLEGKNQWIGLVIQKERDLIRWRQDWLVDQASEERDKNTPAGYLAAAARYAEAEVLSPGDPRVKSGLAEIGPRVQQEVQRYCQRALALKLGSRSLSQGIATAQELQRTLKSVQSVAGALNLDQQMQEEVEKALAALQTSLSRWSDVKRHLDLAQEQQRHALRNPISFSREGNIGWDFYEVESQMDEAETRAGRDQECYELVQAARDGLDELLSQAAELNSAVRAFMTTVKEEQFDDVISQGGSLEERWREARRMGFDGLNPLLDHRYPSGHHIASLTDHQSTAKQQKMDLEEWKRWAATCLEAQGKVTVLASWDRPLEALREQYSLKEIIKGSQNVIQVCNNLAAKLNAPPGRGPLSRKAREEKEQVNDNLWETEFLAESSSVRARADELRKRAQDDLKNFTSGGLLRRLRQAMDRVDREAGDIGKQYGLLRRGTVTQVSPGALKTLAHELELCEVIDPLHDEVIEARARLKELRRAPESEE